MKSIDEIMALADVHARLARINGYDKDSRDDLRAAIEQALVEAVQAGATKEKELWYASPGWEIPEHRLAQPSPKAPSPEPVALTFAAFRAANVARCLKWHPKGIESWSPSDWLTAVTGELGELASLLKMRNRERDGLPGNKFSPTDKQVADELADVLTYLDLLADVLGVNLGAAAVEKFNEVSERVGFPDRIKLSQTTSQEAKAQEPAKAQPEPQPLTTAQIEHVLSLAMDAAYRNGARWPGAFDPLRKYLSSLAAQEAKK
jgi:NTP pyrophosphatase (non-canonical NTP hydrolase)